MFWATCAHGHPPDSTSRDQKTPKHCDRMSGHTEMTVWYWPVMIFMDQTRFHTAQGTQSTPQALITPSTLKKLIKH